jgi:flagellin
LSSSLDSATVRSINYQERTNRKIGSSFRKLSSGKRITRASDDAARLAIATKLDSKTRGQGQALRNTNDAISVIQMAEGSMQGARDGITRVKELAIQSANGAYAESERKLIQLEVSQILDEIDRSSDISSIFGHSLLNGGSDTLEIQADTYDVESSRFKINVKELEMKTDTLGIKGLDVSTAEGARSSLARLDNALTSASNKSALLGSYQQRFNSSIDNLAVSSQNAKAAYSQLMDTDFAHETAVMVKEKIKQDFQTSVPSQISGNLAGMTKLIS